MKLALQIKLLPTEEEFASLKKTLIKANVVCNEISHAAWDKRIFNRFKLQKEIYHPIKKSFNISAQLLIRCISKVTDSYKLDRKRKRNFRPLGAAIYDSRTISYCKDGISIWSVDGRLKRVQFVCHNTNYIPYIKGEAHLVLKNGKFYIFQTVEVPEEDIQDIEEFIGCDFGVNTICATSDGVIHSAEWLNEYRDKKQRVRSSLQSKGTKGAKRLLKRLSGREKTTSKIINHTISKSVVLSAKERGKGVAIEDLTNIRFTSKRGGKKFRTKLGKWNYSQLRYFLTYKCLLHGVPLVVVDPAYTSQTCSKCKHIGERRNKSFQCKNCGNDMDADVNASINIATLGAAINKPESSVMYCSNALHGQF